MKWMLAFNDYSSMCVAPEATLLRGGGRRTDEAGPGSQGLGSRRSSWSRWVAVAMC